MKMTNEEYARLADSMAPRSPILMNVVKAFVSGGLICCLGQGLTLLYTALELPKEQAQGLTSVTLIFLSVLLTALGVYEKLAKHCGAGTLVPITGFANSIESAAIEFKTEGIITGSCVKMFTIAGPVLVCGVFAGVIYAAVYWICLAV